MTWEYLHLIAHSFPIVLSITAVGVGVTGWILQRPDLERWALVALLVAGVFVIPAYITGLYAADVVADRVFVRPGIVQSHRVAATWALIPIVTTGALAGFALYEHEDRRLRHFVIAVGVVAAVVIGYAALLGSRIRHPKGIDGEGAAPAGDPVSAVRADWNEGARGGSPCMNVGTRASGYAARPTPFSPASSLSSPSSAPRAS